MKVIPSDFRNRLALILLICGIAVSGPTRAHGQLDESAREPTMLMDFTGFDWEDVISRLDYLDEYLRNNKQAKAHIFVYGGKIENAPESLPARMRCIDEYLADRRHTSRSSFSVTKGGYRERPTIEFWVSTRHGPKPEPVPTIKKQSVRYKYRRDKTLKFLCNN